MSKTTESLGNTQERHHNIPVRSSADIIGSCFIATCLNVVCSNHPIILCMLLLHVLSAQATRAENSTRRCMIDTACTVGHGEPLTVSICQQLYLIVSYKDANCVDIF